MSLFWIILIFLSCISGFLICTIGSNYIIKKIEYKNIQNQLKKNSGINLNQIDKNFCSTGIYKKILIFMYKTSYQINVLNNTEYITKNLKFQKDFKSKSIKELINKSNFPKHFNNYAYREVQFKLCLLIIPPTMLIASIFSNTLIIISGIIAFIFAINLQKKAMKEEIKSRSFNLEKHLPEMLEVVALGLRSGLTFDRAVKIYTMHFNNEFSDSFNIAQKKWENGLCTIDKALRDLAKTYDSNLFERVIENIIRSLRFGTSFVDCLEDAAIEARESYKNKQKERISKAPVKMMIPTGTLILPAMLMLVLGPVLLELINGF